jgi:hypothetical protein
MYLCKLSPTHNGPSAQRAEENFKIIAEGKEVLTNPETRTEYDDTIAMLPAWPNIMAAFPQCDSIHARGCRICSTSQSCTLSPGSLRLRLG